MDMVREAALPGGELGQPDGCLSCGLAAASTSTEVDEGRPLERERKVNTEVG